jgi:oligopeptide/dipeptide ABC transporter ATP-binding protein
VRHMSDRVAVMYLGSLMELADSRRIYEEPRHPYTKDLIAAIPKTDPAARGRVIPLTGEIPSPLAPPSGCPFRLNCPLRAQACAEAKPPVRELEPGHFVACHFA